MRRSARLVAAVLAVTLVAAGCGLPEDRGPQAVGLPDDLGFGTTSSTTTTTEPDENFDTRIIYLLNEDNLVRVSRKIPAPANNNAIMESLLAGPDEEELDQGITTALPEGLTATVTIAGLGIAEVRLNDAINDVENELQRRAFAQMVWTVTQLSGVTGGVRFRLDENDQYLAPPRGDGTVQPVDPDTGRPEPLVRTDYEPLRPRV